MLFFMRIKAKLTGGRVVWLEDFGGEVTASIAYPSPFGDLVAKRFPRYVILLPDGTAAPREGLVRRWKYA